MQVTRVDGMQAHPGMLLSVVGRLLRPLKGPAVSGLHHPSHIPQCVCWRSLSLNLLACSLSAPAVTGGIPTVVPSLPRLCLSGLGGCRAPRLLKDGSPSVVFLVRSSL